MSERPLLEVRGATKAFGGILALNRVSFDLFEGDILGIIGPNGSGKTTLVNGITGFIKLTSGKIYTRGRDITGRPAHRIADMGITRTFQIMRPYYSLPAYKNLVIPLFSPRAKRTGGCREGKGGRRGIGIIAIGLFVPVTACAPGSQPSTTDDRLSRPGLRGC